jgi:uncharacterized protein (UPF0147 family)
MQREQEDVFEAMCALKELSEDSEIPKNIKLKIYEMIDVLKDDVDASLRIHKVLQKLEDVVEDKNLQPFSRTQIYNLISSLESVSL